MSLFCSPLNDIFSGIFWKWLLLFFLKKTTISYLVHRFNPHVQKICFLHFGRLRDKVVRTLGCAGFSYYGNCLLWRRSHNVVLLNDCINITPPGDIDEIVRMKELKLLGVTFHEDPLGYSIWAYAWQGQFYTLHLKGLQVLLLLLTGVDCPIW